MAGGVEEKVSKENKKDQEKKMSDKEKLVDEEKSESPEHSKEKQESDDSKSEKEPAESQNKSSEDKKAKPSEDKDDPEDEVNEQEEFLKKQEKLLEYVSNIEKQQSVQSHLRPCKSCELLKPYPKDEGWCAKWCPYLRKRTVHKTFWIVSVPADPHSKEEFEKLKEKTEAKKLSLNYKFHIPDLRVGTLDELMYLTEELQNLDTFAEDIIRKFVEFMHEVLGGTGNLDQFFEVNGMDVATYITRFTWNPVKYALKKPLSVLHDLLRAEIRRLGEHLKVRMDDFKELDLKLDKIEKQQTGSLLTRSLAGIVKKEHFVLDSGYLTTLLVVIPIAEEKQWLKSYHGFADMVVPNSAVKIFEDKTHMLYSVVLCKKNMEDFKKNARDKKFHVRDFEFSEEKMAEERDIRKKLQNMKKSQIAVLKRWIKANFSEGFAAWIHVKAMLVLVESVLRFALPSSFQAMILIPLKDKEQLKSALDEAYGNIDNELSLGTAKDVPGTLTAYGVSEYTPYVFSKINFDAKLAQKKD